MSSNDFPMSVRLAVYERSGGYCERCGRPLARGEFHHVLPRKMGGTRRVLNTVDNCLLIHPECHRYIHMHPSEAYLKGWLLEDTAENAEKVSNHA